MPEGVIYYRSNAGEVVSVSKASEAFFNWRGADERWLFMAPHDDDVIIGAGLTVLAAIAEGIETHVVITSDGSMGYCDASQRDTIAQTRRRETAEAYRILGVPDENIHFLGFPDCNLNNWTGRRRAAKGDVAVIEGYAGLQNAYTFVLRRVGPTRVFVPTGTDLHPDHQIAAHEMMICLFHAQGEIWPELGKPISEVPEVYEYATYCDYPTPPQIKIATTDGMLATKMKGIAAYASQRQIASLVELMRKGGPVEYLREVHFHFYSPLVYKNLF